MLKKIRIQNLAVVEDVELTLDKGLNVLTGSTGAGKSLILGAVNLLQGQKASTGSIRAGQDQAVVECEFAIDASGVGESDISLAGGGELNLRREIKHNGRSHAFVNGEPVAVKQLRHLSLQLIEPHGQNEQFRLKNAENHIGYVDVFADNGSLLDRYRDALREYKKAEKELADFDERLSLVKEKRELLGHRVEEIERAQIKHGELETLETKIKLSENSERIFEILNFVYSTLEDDESGASTNVSQAIKQLSRVEGLDGALDELASRLQDAGITIKDCAESARTYLDNVEFDPRELQALQDRRAHLLEFERRYGMPLDEIIEAQKLWAGQLESLTFETEERKTHETHLESARIGLQKTARSLSASRKTAAKRLDKQVNEELKDLMMPGARFRTEIRYEEAGTSQFQMDGVPVEAGPNGTDSVRFLIRTNRGEAEGGVDEIASTGEISRIALALKKVTNVGRPGSVLIFDELDAGVGADLSGPIAEKLLDLSSYYQIICITHLPQIAAAGKRHLVVSKRSVKDRTYAQVSRVDGKDRKREIARMLGGEEGSAKRMALAAEMLDSADSYRQKLDMRP